MHRNVSSFRLIFILPLLFFSMNCFSWNALGHMVVANIAYQNLKPEARKKIDELVCYFQREYSDITSFVKLAYWPDAIRSQKIEMFTHWHYIDIPFSKDGTKASNSLDTDNALWALSSVINVVKNHQANRYERVRFLAFIAHIVGDLHQPLHTVTYYATNFPQGDKGGNRYYIRYNNERENLHHLWDSGVGVFNMPSTVENATMLANNISTLYPKPYFGDKASDLNPEHWTKEGMENAKKHVYSTPEKQPVSAFYLQNGKMIAQQEIALAGYRLAALLNQLLANEHLVKSAGVEMVPPSINTKQDYCLGSV